MNISPEELELNGYKLLEKLPHNDLPPFLKQYLNKKNRIFFTFYSITLLLLGIAVYFFIDNFYHNYLKIADWFYHYCLGFSIAFLLIPIHEYIHVLAYKSQGAQNTSYDYNLKKFYFMALAHKFVANKKEFQIVALAPFVVISSILIIALFFSSYNLTLTILGTLFCHTAMSSGDFALLSFFEFHKDKEILTYDEIDEKISYFYRK